MAKDTQSVADEDLDVESEVDANGSADETPKPKPKPKADAKGGKGKGDAKADDSEAEANAAAPHLFTAEEYEEFQALKEQVAGIDLSKIKQLLPEAEREKARLNAQRKAAEKRAKDAEAEKASVEEEMRAKIEALESKWADSEKRAADKELGSVVDAYCRGLSFVGATPDLQRAAGSNFADIARRALKAEHDEDGEITITGAKDGKPARDILKALAETHAYLIARKGKPGPTNPGGGGVPPGYDDGENATEAAIAALKARRSRS